MLSQQLIEATRSGDHVMTIHETRTRLSPAAVMELARSFFTLAGSSYAAFPEQSGDGFLKLHLEVGEIVIGTLPQGDSTLVRGSASRGGHLLTRFLTSLAHPHDATQTSRRYGVREARGAQVERVVNRTAPVPVESELPSPRAA